MNYLKKEKILDPVTFFNLYKHDAVLELLQGSDYDFDNNNFTIRNDEKFNPNYIYSPFTVLSILRFKGNHRAAYEWVNFTLMENECEFIRVGASYFKKVKQLDRFGIERLDIKPWKKEEIVQDFNKKFVDFIPRFDNFIIEPNNLHHNEVIGCSYNLYSAFSHRPKEGELEWTDVILQHIFGEQLEMGCRYLKCLYEHPKQIMPILVLASKTRQTGKTTFLNWLNQIFGANMVVINPEDIMSQFNSSYAKSNIIAIEETVSDKSATVEKLKALSTQKFVNMNQKFVDNYKLPFFGKFIITTNDENKFMKVDQEEIRFWVRQIPEPRIQCADIENRLISEIPAFLYYLQQLPAIDFSKSRMVFTVEELKTESLEKVKQESKPQLYKDLCMHFEDWFANNQSFDVCTFTAIAVKTKWFNNNSNISPSYIRTILRDYFDLKPSEKTLYLQQFNEGLSYSGKFYKLNRTFFQDTVLENDENEAPY